MQYQGTLISVSNMEKAKRFYEAESVARRFLKQGLSVEETAQRTMFPVEFVKSIIL